MEKMKNYVCIFPGLYNYHLNKDVGMIPYTVGRFFNFNSEIVTYKNDNYSVYDHHLQHKNFHITFLEKNKHEKWDIIKYIARNGGRIDVLQYFHLRYWNIILYSIAYKLVNHSGYFYVKLDANDPIISFLVDRKGVNASLRRVLMRFVFKHFIDLVSIETQRNYKKLAKSKVVSEEKLLFLPNGIEILSKQKSTPKKNQILTVGFLGSEAKGTEILLEAFAQIKDLKDWELVLVGDVDEPFQAYLSKYFNNNPHLKDKIVFKGYVSDRDDLYNYYKDSKIFCFPSRTESFGIALIEAAFFGNYIISTNVGAAPDLFEIYDHGELMDMDDAEGLGSRLQDLIITLDKIDIKNEENANLIRESYDWKILCQKIVNHII
jgi:glycosyltransferase involved in cell wall biosynthesis